jgi:hypothetical protein
LTSTIPIVFTEVGDAVESGFVARLARPGGNITGFESLQPAMGGKWLEVLKEATPNLSRVAVLFGSDSAANVALLYTLEVVAPSLRSDIDPPDLDRLAPSPMFGLDAREPVRIRSTMVSMECPCVLRVPRAKRVSHEGAIKATLKIYPQLTSIELIACSCDQSKPSTTAASCEALNRRPALDGHSPAAG